MPRFTQIKAISDVRRLPRLGKIHLGIKAKSKKTGSEYPKEVDYFVFGEDELSMAAKAIYDGTPKELDVLFPTEDRGQVFPQAYKKYGSGAGLVCTGDGERCLRRPKDGGEMIEADCLGPDECEFAKGDCKRVGNLMVVLYRVSLGGVFQIDTSSWNSIVNINSGLDYVQQVCGRIAGVPLKLARVPQETLHEGKKATHFTLRITVPSFAQMEKLLPEATGVRKLLAAALHIDSPNGIEEELYRRPLVETNQKPSLPAPKAKVEKPAEEEPEAPAAEKEETQPEFTF